MKNINVAFKQYLANNEQNFASCNYIIKLLPYLSITSLVYMDIVDRSFINANKAFKQSITQAASGPAEAWEIYQKQKKLLKHHFKTYCDNWKAAILQQCKNLGCFEQFFQSIGFGDLLQSDQLPDQAQYDELVGASKHDKSAKIMLTQLRTSVKNELEERIKNARLELIQHIFSNNIDIVRGVPESPDQNMDNENLNNENLNNENLNNENSV